jgi:pimeloyl-ACP methyl ester carboxylesterase
VATEPPPGAYRGGDGPPLLLLHGLSGTWRNWRPVLALLEPHHDVLAPTLPGHHGGPLPAAGLRLTLDALADAIEHHLDDAGIESAHIAGNSLGGWLALELARRGRARSVTALSPGGAWRDAADLRRLRFTLRAGHAALTLVSPRADRMLARPRLRRLVLRTFVVRPDAVDRRLIAEAIEDAAGCLVFRDLLDTLARQGPFTASVNEIDCPIVIASGEHDRLLPFDRHIRPLLKALPNARFVPLDGVGHVPMFDEPQLTARTILDTIREADTRRNPPPGLNRLPPPR